MPYTFARIGIEPSRLFSRDQMPPAPHAERYAAGTYTWHFFDSARANRARPHPRLGATDVEYRFNRLGYRAPEFPDAADTDDRVSLVCIGSSGLFGAGLPESETLPAQAASLLETRLGRSVRYWNLGSGGTGADYVTRMLFSAIPVLAPDLLLITTFPFNRREFINEQGHIFSGYGSPNWHQRFTNPEQWRLDTVCSNISNAYTDSVNFMTNFKVWEHLCDSAKLPWVFTTEAYSQQLDELLPLMTDPRRSIAPGIHALIDHYRGTPATGLARDMLHAGSEPTARLAADMVNALFQIYPQSMAALRQTDQHNQST